MLDKEIKSGTEFINDRGSMVINNKSGSIVFDENTGQERLQLSHSSGANVNFNNKTVSTFAPNNMQDLTKGNKFSTTIGDSFSQTNNNKEERVYGDHTIIAGSPKFFTEGLADQWLTEAQDIAVAKAGPEKLYGGTGNNTDAAYPVDGKVDPNSGAIEGGTFATNKAQDNIQQLMEEKAAPLSNIEKEMGVGGSIKMLTTKHFVVNAGAKPVSFDSGLIVKNGKSVTQNYVVENGKAKEITTSVPVYESKDTSSAVPFGDIQLIAGTKFRATAGSGGVSFTSSGDNSFTGTGRTTIGGAEVAIAGSTIGDAGRVTIISDTDLYMEANQIITRNTPRITDRADITHTFVTPDAFFTGNVHIMGDLTVEGNITVNGSVGIKVPNSDVCASGISLVKHVHGGVCRSGQKTDGPQ